VPTLIVDLDVGERRRVLTRGELIAHLELAAWRTWFALTLVRILQVAWSPGQALGVAVEVAGTLVAVGVKGAGMLVSIAVAVEVAGWPIVGARVALPA
jgi:hypothetical protein